MKEGYFVNIAIHKAIELYLTSEKKQDSILYNSFFVVVIRILTLIYGRLDILNPYYLNNSIAFMNNLAKFGMNKSDLALFKEEFLSYYQFECNSKSTTYKLSNPYFKKVIEYLIDMFVRKKKSIQVSIEEEETFLDLIYSTHTKDFYRISDGYLNGNFAKYFEKYYYSKLNEMDMTREMDFNKTISTNLNLEALNYVGVSLSNLKNMKNEEIEKAKSNAYQYFLVDANSPSREEELKEKIDYYKMYGHKVTSGNGYVDILLLLSVIMTSFSVLFIFILNL